MELELSSRNCRATRSHQACSRGVMASPPFTVGAAVEGILALNHRGSNGFGYDPIFIPHGYEQTFGELPSDIKHTLSHRGRAARALKVRLEA